MKVMSVFKEYPLDMSIFQKTVGHKTNYGDTPVRMEEHLPIGDGDVHYVEVYYDNGTMQRICRPDSVTYEGVE
jgi:hypothetical protein